MPKSGSSGSKTVTDNRDASTEELLDSLGFTYRYVQLVPLDEIEKHKDAQSRLGNTPKDRVKTYAESMRQGTLFPPVVLWDDPQNKDGFLLIDGSTRCGAKRQIKATHVDGYVVDIESPDEAVVLSAIFNGRSGMPLTMDEKRRAILKNMALGKRSLTAARLAKHYGITESVISRIVNTKKTTDDFEALGIDVDLLSDAHIVAMKDLGDAAVKRDIASLIVDGDMKVTDLRKLVKEVGEKSSEAERLGHIAAVRTDYEPAIVAKKAGRSSNVPVVHAAMVYGRLVKLIAENPKADEWVPGNAERRQEHIERVTGIIEFLGKVSDALTAAAAADVVEAAEAAAEESAA